MLNDLMPLANKLADGMIEKIKKDGLEPELCEKSDKLYAIVEKTIDTFILKFVPLMIEYSEKNFADEIDEETFKNLIGYHTCAYDDLARIKDILREKENNQ